MTGNDTLDYYERHAEAFFRSTKDADMEKARDRFLAALGDGKEILDFGCGSGRDALAFLQKGYAVTAVDGSPALCRAASELTGQEVRCMRFEDLEDPDAYDGIWACASILHLEKESLRQVFFRMYRALKKKGVLYASFKYGTFAGVRSGRYFTDFTEETFSDFLAGIPGFRVEETWISRDVRPGREAERWLNLLIRRSED